MIVTLRPIVLIGAVFAGTLLGWPHVPNASGQDRGDAIESQDKIDVSADLQGLRNIKDSMEWVARRLEQADTSEQTQVYQQNILLQLDEMIQSQKDQQSQQQIPDSPDSQSSDEATDGGTGAMPDASGQGAPGGRVDSTDRADPIDHGTLMRRAWGHLPARVRSKMQTALGEQFLPKYEKLIEDYYKRLADRK